MICLAILDMGRLPGQETSNFVPEPKAPGSCTIDWVESFEVMHRDRDLLERVVRVEVRFKTQDGLGPPGYATGFRVGPGQILTARHVVERGPKDAIERAAEIRVRLDPDGGGEDVIEAPATVAWVGESELAPGDRKALDVALLADELPGDDLEPFRRWVRLPLGRSGRWWCEGFPQASPDTARMGTEYLSGECHPARERATFLKLTVERAPPQPGRDGSTAWHGLSGAPVFVAEGRYQGHLYGIVRSSPKRFPDIVRAVGTPALLRDAELRRRLGFEEPAPPHASLVEELRQVLEEDPLLAERLAATDASWKARWNDGGGDELVDALCAEGKLGTMLERLRRLDQGVERKSAAGERLRQLAVVLASILAGRELPGGERLNLEAARRVRLGTASPNFAEALLASAYGTPCLYEKAAGPDLPRAWLRVPTSAMEAGMRAPSQVGEQLEELLAVLTEKCLDDPRFLLPAQKALVSTLPPGQRREQLRELLKRSLTRLEERHGRRAYLAADGELQQKMGRHLDTFLDRLGKILPNLDLVVLDTGAEPVARAIEEEDELWPLWEILDLLPDLRSE